MTLVISMIGASIVVQACAAVAAFRLHWVYGPRWAWTAISVAITLMTVRRCETYYRWTIGDLAAVDLEEPLPFLTSAALTLTISTLLFVGVGLIEPVFRNIQQAEALLKDQNEALAQVVRLNEAEFSVARQIQESLFPAKPPDLAGFEIAGASYPALSAGGDFYDYLWLPDGTLGLVVADASGHGVGPAMIMAETRAYLRAIARTTADCGTVLTSLNKFLCEDHRDTGFVTCFFAKLDNASRLLSYSAAGHEAYLVDPNGSMRTLESQGMPLGLFEDANYEMVTVGTLVPSAVLMLVSDGIIEAHSPQRELFGRQRLVSVVAQPDRSAQDMLTAVFQAIDDFSSHTPQADDMTALLVRGCPQPQS